MKQMLLALMLCAVATTAHAEPPRIEAAQAAHVGMGWRIDVTLRHPDTGWDHYADGWRIEAEDGTVLATRVLHHPHVDEQPFTRSLMNVMLPDGTRQVFVRAKCSVDGWASDRIALRLDPME